MSLLSKDTKAFSRYSFYPPVGGCAEGKTNKATAEPLAKIGQKIAVKQRFVCAFGIFANVSQLWKVGDLEAQNYQPARKFD